MTLIELTVVVLVLLSLISILFIGARAWKEGADRAGCVVRIRQVQMGVRSFANSRGLLPNTDTSPLSLKNEIIGADRYVEVEPLCPGNGLYSFNGNTVPPVGSLFMTCSLAGSNKHEPKTFSQW